jgi:hypothetical protein
MEEGPEARFAGVSRSATTGRPPGAISRQKAVDIREHRSLLCHGTTKYLVAFPVAPPKSAVPAPTWPVDTSVYAPI